MKQIAILLLFFVMSHLAFPENPVEMAKEGVTLSGRISDKSDGEILIGATVYFPELGRGAVSNEYGFYSIIAPKGIYNIKYTFIGYEELVLNVNLQADTTLNIEMTASETQLNEVVIEGKAKNENIRSMQMSVNKMDSKTIKSIPAFMGEVDVIKAIQLLPGVQQVSEGSSGFSVRGGSPDQNLILLDEATVYNASHLLGFFSVFNNDVVKSVELYKGDIPAKEGGRLSSLVDIRMRDGNTKKFSGRGGIGLISSRLTLEGPIKKDKSSFVIAGRRTYADLFLAFSGDENLRNNTLYFYDLNAKVNYQINDKNQVFLSGYYGKDVFKNGDFFMNWGNYTGTLRWNHLFNDRLFSNFSLIYSQYDYGIGIPEGEPNSFDWTSSMSDIRLKGDFTYYLNSNNTIRFGLSSIHHSMRPGTARGTGDEAFFTELVIPNNYALESGVYVSNEQKIGSRFNLKYGLRLSIFNNIGSGISYIYDDAYVEIDSAIYSSGEIFNTYWGLEPRLGITYMLDEVSSLKAAYSRNNQYVHLAQNSTAGTPLDIWFPSSPNVKPQIGNLFSLGYFRNFKKGRIEASVEAYYKTNQNAVDFKDHATLLLNKYLEGELRFGDAWSYGIECMIRVPEGRLNGWISYTYSRAFRNIPEINNGNTYLAGYDKPHDISIVLSYALSKRIDVGANWIYQTGLPVTYPTGRFSYGNVIAPVYSNRNDYRMPDYHRLDVSVTLKSKEKPNRKWQGEWNLSVYNAYNRKNPWVINFLSDPNQPGTTYAEATYLFAIVPSISYNFKF